MAEMQLTQPQIALSIARLLRAELSESDSAYSFAVRDIEVPASIVLEKARLNALFTTVSEMQLNEETALHSDQWFEIAVSEETQSVARRIRDGAVQLQDSDAGISYEFSSASDEYIIWLIGSRAGGMRELRDLGLGGFMSRYRVRRLYDEDANRALDALEVLRIASFRLLTVKIRSQTKFSLRRFQVALNAFQFHIAYNLDIALAPLRYLQELSRRGRLSRMRRSTAADLDPPRRTYNEDLVNHYILAVSTDNPTVQFLSFYHVLEHFFEAVFNDDLIDQIKGALTQPGFSFKRKKDIGQLISTIRRSLQVRSETITFSESEALRLSLTKYVDIANLIEKLDEYDPALVGFYAGTEVPFSKGSAVDLRGADPDRILRDLSKRIYATRNALVHSKDGDKFRYTPFKDERALIMEVPLMRFISEAVILSVSELAP